MDKTEKFLVFAIFKGNEFVVAGKFDTIQDTEHMINNHSFKGKAPLFVMRVDEYREKVIDG